MLNINVYFIRISTFYTKFSAYAYSCYLRINNCCSDCRSHFLSSTPQGQRPSSGTHLVQVEPVYPCVQVALPILTSTLRNVVLEFTINIESCSILRHWSFNLKFSMLRSIVLWKILSRHHHVNSINTNVCKIETIMMLEQNNQIKSAEDRYYYSLLQYLQEDVSIYNCRKQWWSINVG